jgi:hypothetical protein
MKPTSEMKGFNMVRVLLRASHGYITCGYYKDGMIKLDGTDIWIHPEEYESFVLLGEMEVIINKSGDGETPYLETSEVVVNREYNPNYGDDRICKCGHPYYRHFDPFEHMEAVGCKYCGCQQFEKAE